MNPITFKCKKNSPFSLLSIKNAILVLIFSLNVVLFVVTWAWRLVVCFLKFSDNALIDFDVI